MEQKATLLSTIRGYLYILPALIILMVFHVYPILKSLDMSFYTSFNFIHNVVYARGLDNFYYIFNDSEFWLALRNTFIFVFGVVPISISISLVIAVMLNSISAFSKLFRSIYFTPFVTSTVAIAMVWRWIYHSRYGVLNNILTYVGFSPVAWVTDPDWAMVSLIILSIWQSLGYNIIIFLAGLQNINKQHYYAAQIDGASSLRRFFHITIPMLSPTIFFVSIMSVISAFKVFEEVYALFDKRPGPLYSCYTIVYYIYDKFANKYQYGIASAAVFVLLIIIMSLTLLQLYIGKRKVYYT